jgi:hypothetical protein
MRILVVFGSAFSTGQDQLRNQSVFRFDLTDGLLRRNSVTVSGRKEVIAVG